VIRLVLAEDQAMVRGALAALLRLETDLEVVAEAGDGHAAWAEVCRHRPDILLTDIEMPGMTGLDLALKLQAGELPTKVVILTTFARAGYLRRALDAGVRGAGTCSRTRPRSSWRRPCGRCRPAAAPSIRSWRWRPGANRIR
jgi:two-component system response regulator DesR